MTLLSYLTVLLGLLASTFNLTAQNEMVVAGPQIQFEENAFDFGQVEMGTQVSHVFRFQNIGDEELIASHAKPGCGCTKVVFKADTLAPGDWGSIELRFDTNNRLGRESLSFTLWHNAPGKMTKIKVKGEVLVPKESDPIPPQ